MQTHPPFFFAKPTDKDLTCEQRRCLLVKASGVCRDAVGA